MDAHTLDGLFGPWFHIPVGIGLAAGLFWVLRRMQPGAHALVIVSQAMLVAAIVLYVPLGRTSERFLLPVTAYLAATSIVCGIIALCRLGLKVGIWGLLVPAIAIALSYLVYLWLNALVGIL